MKKLTTLLVILSLVLAIGGFAAASPVTTIADVLKNGVEDQRVTLEGTVVQQIRHEHFMFRDSTGDLEIEVDDELLRLYGDIVNQSVRIHGKVDKEHNRMTVDVKTLEVLK